MITGAAVMCLALNVYFEARNEDTLGQLAVAEVTLNRVESSAFPNEVCKVVKQGYERGRHRCQFSWYCDGKSDKPRNPKAWRKAIAVASYALEQEQNTLLASDVLYYHADYVKSGFHAGLNYERRIGSHIFYTAKDQS